MVDTLVWISGASSGIGAALAATVPLPSPRVLDISRSGGTAGTEHVPADLSDPAAWAAVGAHFASELAGFRGDRAVFVHCAGLLRPIGFVGEVDDDAYATNVLVNSAAPQVLGHLFLRALTDSGFAGRADLVMLSSGAATKPYAGWSSYSAGKAAIDAWVSAAGQEQEARGGRCRVLSVAPGVVATPMQEQIRQVSERDFPQVGKFQELHASGSLRPPEVASRDIWALLDRSLANGARVDARSLS